MFFKSINFFKKVNKESYKNAPSSLRHNFGRCNTPEISFEIRRKQRNRSLRSVRGCYLFHRNAESNTSRRVQRRHRSERRWPTFCSALRIQGNLLFPVSCLLTPISDPKAFWRVRTVRWFLRCAKRFRAADRFLCDWRHERNHPGQVQELRETPCPAFPHFP